MSSPLAIETRLSFSTLARDSAAAAEFIALSFAGASLTLPMPTAPASRNVQRVFRNNGACVAWIFVAVWLAMLGCFTYIAIRDGGIPQVGVWAWPILGLFWLFGAAALVWVTGLPLLRLELSADGVLVRERFPWYVQETRYRVRELRLPQLESVVDGDGDAQFHCVLAFADGRRLVVAESPHRPQVEATFLSLQASLAALCRGYADVVEATAVQAPQVVR